MHGNNVNILVVDGQGGRIGQQLVERLKASIPRLSVTAVGTNSIATSAMLKAGADNGATGENAVLVNSRTADIIIGPIGIVIADSLFGEITATMATAVGQSPAKRFLIPLNLCNNIIVGIADLSTSKLIQNAVNLVEMELEQ